ncbi:MAG TPA: hypothetical protein VL100_12505 [Croceibacterium sp.]|nr:hypothetical protein [Croceibacterium sp.]
MKLALAVIAVTAMVSVSCAASAQDTYKPTGSRIGRPAPVVTPNSSNLSNEEGARRMTDDFASCIYRKSKNSVNAALALRPDSKEANAALGRLVRDDCYAANASLSIPQSLLRGALFRAKLLTEFGGKDVALAPEPVDYTQFVPSPLQSEDRSYVAFGDFADCVVRADLDGARKFVEPDAGSEVETQALNALIPKLGPCLTNGLEITFSKSVLQALLAEAIYHETAAAALENPPTEAAQKLPQGA